MIGSSIDNKPPKTNELTIDEGDEKNTSFSHKLDISLKPAAFGKSILRLLLYQNRNHRKVIRKLILITPEILKKLPNHTSNSLSNVHFETVRDSPITTLGTGNLKSDDFDVRSICKKGDNSITI